MTTETPQDPVSFPHDAPHEPPHGRPQDGSRDGAPDRSHDGARDGARGVVQDPRRAPGDADGDGTAGGFPHAPDAAREFPREFARTRRYTLGTPRAFSVAPDGERVVFVRSRSGTDGTHLLWALDVARGTERLVADPAILLGGRAEHLSAKERAYRERVRETGAGVVAYTVDAAVEHAVFALSGRLFTVDLRPGAVPAGEGDGGGTAGGGDDSGAGGAVTELPVPGPVLDPRLSPDGRHVAYASQGGLRVVERAGGGEPEVRVLAEPDGPEVAWGLAEFVAAEEMHRARGFWWSPDSDRLLVARVDDSPVQGWWMADPAHPDRRPVRVAYPAAGTPNADVRLFLLDLDGSRTEVVWDRARYPYLARVHWSSAGAPLLLVQARDQLSQLILSVDTSDGATRPVHADEDPDFLDLFPGVPSRAPSGRLVRIADEGGARVLALGDRPLTGPQLQVRAVLDVSDDDALITASAGEAAADPELGEIHVYRVNELGVERVSREPGVHTAVRGGPSTVLVSARADRPGSEVRVLREGREVARIATLGVRPVLSPRLTLTEAGERRIPCAVLLPHGYRDGDGPLPVLLDPYGGPHGQQVLAAHDRHLSSQWFAEQGFAVLVADGRGSRGRSPAWEKAVKNDIAAVVLEDQVAALHALAGRFPLDLGRVAIRGWSFGGYLAGLAALRRPDVFHAAIAGAPVTDLRLYDTHYQERYCGDPNTSPEVFERNSLVTDAGLVEAREPARPLLLVHGLADDNVVVAHSLRLSAALLAAGRPHEVLPLSGVTHMTPQEQVAENLLLFQVHFLRRALGLAAPGTAAPAPDGAGASAPAGAGSGS